jgi:hypothetical protein
MIVGLEFQTFMNISEDNFNPLSKKRLSAPAESRFY